MDGGYLPFAFFNGAGELVGFDAEMAHSLADSLGLGLAFVDTYFTERMHHVFPNAELRPIESIKSFLDAEDGEFEAMIVLAEVGSAWTLRHPEFSVIIPKPAIERVPLAYLLPAGDADWVNSVNSWIELKKADGTIRRLYDYWILGRGTERTGPRWSIIRDVLHWIE